MTWHAHPVRLRLSRAKGFDLQAWSREPDRCHGAVLLALAFPSPTDMETNCDHDPL